jgi:omega-hydroxy-beta-dihydromenaquinone-9 sulfotransferase
MSKNKKSFKIDLITSAGNSFPNWIKVLVLNKFQVGFKYIPRALLVTVVTLVLSPFVIIEKILFNGKIKKAKIVSPVFIIGHMRSGTTFLHLLLSQDNRFAFPTTSETIFPWIFFTLDKLIRSFTKYVLPEKRPMDNMDFKEENPQEEEFAIANLCPYSPNIGAYFPKNLEKFYRNYSLFENVDEKIINKWKSTYSYYLKKITLKNKGKRILSKSLVNSGRIKQLLEMFPDAKFISIHRNPYNVFLSTKKLYKKLIFKNMSFQEINDNELESGILTLAEIGYKRYLEVKKLLNKNNLIEVKYESFVKSPLKHIKKIYKELNISGYDKVEPCFKALLNDYQNYKADSYIIDPVLKNRIYKKLKIIFDNFGYSKII